MNTLPKKGLYQSTKKPAMATLVLDVIDVPEDNYFDVEIESGSFSQLLSNKEWQTLVEQNSLTFERDLTPEEEESQSGTGGITFI
jgi:hypothetical protein